MKLLLLILVLIAVSVPAEAVQPSEAASARGLVSSTLRLGRKMLHRDLDTVNFSGVQTDTRRLLSDDCGNPCGPICCQEYEACLAVPMLGQFCFDYQTVSQSSASRSDNLHKLYTHTAMALKEP